MLKPSGLIHKRQSLFERAFASVHYFGQ